MTLFSSDFLTRISFRGDWLFAYGPVSCHSDRSGGISGSCFRFLALRAESKRCLDPFDFAQGKTFARHDK